MAALLTCIACGYRIGDIGGVRCPECGRGFDRALPPTFGVSMDRPTCLVRVDAEWLGEAIRSELLAAEVLSGIEVSLIGVVGFSNRRQVSIFVDEEDHARAVAVLADSTRGDAAAWSCPACGEDVPGSFDACWSCGAEAEERRAAHPRPPGPPVAPATSSRSVLRPIAGGFLVAAAIAALAIVIGVDRAGAIPGMLLLPAVVGAAVGGGLLLRPARPSTDPR